MVKIIRVKYIVVDLTEVTYINIYNVCLYKAGHLRCETTTGEGMRSLGTQVNTIDQN